MKMKGAKTDWRGNDASVDHNYNERNTGKGNGQIREVIFRAVEKLQHDFREHDERVEPEEVQRIENSPNIPQNGLPNELCHGRTKNEDG